MTVYLNKIGQMGNYYYNLPSNTSELGSIA